MTENCSRNISPDGLTGMIFAMDGMQDTVVLLNGPMGCKFYHSTTSQFLTPRPPLYLPSENGADKTPVGYNFLNQWFFRQSRVPCTYLDGYDYVYGTTEKVREALLYLKENVAFSCIALINSPGASLIGDHLHELIREILPDRICVVLESPGYSTGFAAGYETAFTELLRQTGDRMESYLREKEEAAIGAGHPRVNLLGVSLWQRYCEGDIRELKRLFSLCGIEVGCCLFAGNRIEELLEMPQADLNVVLYPEMAELGAKQMKERFGIPFYLCEELPVGFDAVEKMFRDICEILHVSPEPVLKENEEARAKAYYYIDSVHQMSGLPNGTTFALEGNQSQVYSYARFFCEYLGMTPDCLEVTENSEAGPVMTAKIDTLYQMYGQSDRKSMTETNAELVFGDGNTIAMLQTRSDAFCGIEISFPGMGYTDIVPKTHMGIQGALFLIEQVLNGLMSRI